jgi:O-antigen/teichoic acid export membrane protein
MVGLDKGLVDVAGGNTIASLIGAVFWLVIATLMSNTDYGKLNYYLSISTLFSIVSMLGLGTTMITFLSKNDEEVRYQANLIVIFSNCIIGALLFVFINHLSVVILLLGLSFFTMSQMENLGRRNYKSYSYTAILQRLLNVPLSLLLYFIIGIDGIIIGYATSTLLFSYNFFKSFRGAKFKFSSLMTKLPFISHSYVLDISNSVARNLDKLLIAPVFGFGVLGLYQIGFQFLTFLYIIPLSLFQFLLPQEAAKIQGTKVVIKGLAVAIIFSISLFIAMPTIISHFFPNFTQSIHVSQIMILGIIPLTLSSVLYSRFFGREKSKAVLIPSSVRVFTLIILILFLGKTFGLIGLGIATLISLSLETSTLLIVSKLAFNKINKDDVNHTA